MDTQTKNILTQLSKLGVRNTGEQIRVLEYARDGKYHKLEDAVKHLRMGKFMPENQRPSDFSERAQEVMERVEKEQQVSDAKKAELEREARHNAETEQRLNDSVSRKMEQNKNERVEKFLKDREEIDEKNRARAEQLEGLVKRINDLEAKGETYKPEPKGAPYEAGKFVDQYNSEKAPEPSVVKGEWK